MDGNLPERSMGVARRKLVSASAIGRDGEPAAFLDNCRFHVAGGDGDVLLGFELAIKQNLKKPPAKRTENSSAFVGVYQDDGGYVVFGQVEHVALIAEEAAAVMHDGNAPLRIDLETHAVGDIIADLDLPLAALHDIGFGGDALALREQAP